MSAHDEVRGFSIGTSEPTIDIVDEARLSELMPWEASVERVHAEGYQAPLSVGSSRLTVVAGRAADAAAAYVARIQDRLPADKRSAFLESAGAFDVALGDEDLDGLLDS